MSNPSFIDTKRILALDGIRGIAFLMVFGAHIGILSSGFFGVDLFFVLSGFLITSLLLQEQKRYASINLYKFYLRRALRLLPALFGVLLGVLLYTGIMLPFSKFLSALSDAWRIMLYIWNWTLSADWSVTKNWSYIVEHHQHMYNHLWSLSVEEQFYIVWPCLLLILLKLPRKVVLFFLLIGIVAPALARFICWHEGSSLWIYFRTDMRLDNLFYGVFVAWLVNWGIVPKGKSRVLLSWAGMIAFIGLIGLGIPDFLTHGEVYQGLFSLAALFSALLIASAVYCPLAPLKYLLELRLLCWIGKISYGLYLWHYPVVEILTGQNFSSPFLRDLAITVTTFTISAISYYKLELPFLKLKEKIAHVNPSSFYTGDLYISPAPHQSQ
ncbi:O-antigen acetylase [Legionella santicrucis]|uniref:O-antigen acetylase n=1 Tax=Legionella santicrucis TaxID=45074 RepID=A0A0W0YLK2_9GAMM|nr:acyltransferase [Legionella santicrucis]KTD57762.1 O-antigen acetylase [Legionella santicrucis]